MNNGIAWLALALALSLGNGCLGYRLGSMADPQLKTIAVARVDNDTDEPRVSAYAASRLRSRLVTDGALRLVESSDADCILKARVRSYAVSSVGSAKLPSADPGQQLYMTSVWRVTVTVEYSLVAPRGDKPLIAPRTVNGAAEYTDLIDLDVVRQDGLRQALYDAAGKIVRDVTEKW